jgi:hypothetical protein
VPGVVETSTFIIKFEVAVPPDGGVMVLGWKPECVTPRGAPENDRVIGELNPFEDFTVIVEFSAEPCSMVREFGEAEMMKSGTTADITVRSMFTEWLVPFVPVTVSVYAPGTEVAETLINKIDVAEPPEDGVTDVGLKVDLTPVGAPDTVRSTLRLKPLIDVMVMMDMCELS